MKKFIKIDYYIQIFLACIVNPIAVLSMFGIMLAFPIIGIYQLISDFLHLFIYQTTYLQKQRTIHFYGAIVYVVVVGLCTYGLKSMSLGESSGFILFIIFYIVIPEIMIWVRFSWARKHFMYEKSNHHDEVDLIEELQEI
jgi:hypothetical protein